MKKEKNIVINTPTGQYHIPLILVAEHRADYYICQRDGKPRGCAEWKREVSWVLDDPYEGIDWILNNTSWADWESLAVKINDKVLVNESDFWTSSDGFTISLTICKAGNE